jgi:hypothetical protein
MSTKPILGLPVALLAAITASAQPYSVWLPRAQELVITPGYAFQTFDNFWAGKQSVALDHSLNQHTMLLGCEYGVTENLALDLTGGYVWTHTRSGMLGGHQSDDGIIDTTFGARYRLLDEETIALSFVPSVGVRAGGIVEGTYDENFPFSAGDGASGSEASLLLGKAICLGFGLFGDLGYRWRNHDVPDDVFGSAGFYATFRAFTAHVAYRHTQSTSGKDIGQVPFPEVKEINQTIEGGIGFTDPGNRYYQIFYAHTLDGRNTGEKDIIGAAISLSY